MMSEDLEPKITHLAVASHEGWGNVASYDVIYVVVDHQWVWSYNTDQKKWRSIGAVEP